MKSHLTSSIGFGISSAVKRPATADAPVRRPKILVVDPDPDLRRVTATRLAAAHHVVECAASAQAALDACVRSRPNLVIADFELADMDGISFLKELKGRWPDMTVILLTAHGTIADAVQATQRGAFGFLVKPVGKEELLGQVQRAIAVSSFTLAAGDWRAQIVSRSQLMEDRLSIANRAAASDEPILLTGESGTGKELLARAIHAASARRDQPFVCVPCGNASAQQLELQLFGDAGSEGVRPAAGGAFNQANGGTLLLDEVAGLPIRLQVLLARWLEVRRLPAADRPVVRSDVRLVCTSSKDLRSLAARGDFFAPLLDHIAILPIEIPPLGRRREDIPLLVSHFLNQATTPGDPKKMYSPKAIELLATTDWPGNVRQLFDLVKQNVALSQGRVITREFVQQSLAADSLKIPTYEQAREQFSQEYLSANLQLTAGNVSRSARIAKRNRTDFYKLLARHRLHPDDFKSFQSLPRTDSRTQTPPPSDAAQREPANDELRRA
jgi:two-component system response regulator GlrR